MCFCLVAEKMRYNFEDWNARAGVFGYCDVGNEKGLKFREFEVVI